MKMHRLGVVPGRGQQQPTNPLMPLFEGLSGVPGQRRQRGDGDGWTPAEIQRVLVAKGAEVVVDARDAQRPVARAALRAWSRSKTARISPRLRYSGAVATISGRPTGRAMPS